MQRSLHGRQGTMLLEDEEEVCCMCVCSCMRGCVWVCMREWACTCVCARVFMNLNVV
jgi:hypothetical protein